MIDDLDSLSDPQLIEGALGALWLVRIGLEVSLASRRIGSCGIDCRKRSIWKRHMSSKCRRSIPMKSTLSCASSADAAVACGTGNTRLRWVRLCFV